MNYLLDFINHIDELKKDESKEVVSRLHMIENFLLRDYSYNLDELFEEIMMNEFIYEQEKERHTGKPSKIESSIPILILFNNFKIHILSTGYILRYSYSISDQSYFEIPQILKKEFKSFKNLNLKNSIIYNNKYINKFFENIMNDLIDLISSSVNREKSIEYHLASILKLILITKEESSYNDYMSGHPMISGKTIQLKNLNNEDIYIFKIILDFINNKFKKDYSYDDVKNIYYDYVSADEDSTYIYM